jgi:hypothetical protein
MKTMMKYFTVLAVLTAISFTLAAQDKTLLEYRYKAGKSYRYKNLSNYDMVQEMNGQEMKMSGNSSSIVRMEISSVSSTGDMTSVNVYEEMKTVVKNAMMDTTMEQKEVIGKRGRVVFSKLGAEIKKEVIDTVKVGAMAAGSNTLLTSGLMRLPDHPVAIGEKWSNEHADTMKIGEGNMITTAHTDFTMIGSEQKNEKSCYKFSYVSKSETTGKMTQMGMEIFVEGTGDTIGNVWIDSKEGILICKESITNQEMTYAMTGQMKMSVPSTQTIRSNYNLIE